MTYFHKHLWLKQSFRFVTNNSNFNLKLNIQTKANHTPLICLLDIKVKERKVYVYRIREMTMYALFKIY